MRQAVPAGKLVVRILAEGAALQPGALTPPYCVGFTRKQMRVMSGRGCVLSAQPSRRGKPPGNAFERVPMQKSNKPSGEDRIAIQDLIARGRMPWRATRRPQIRRLLHDDRLIKIDGEWLFQEPTIRLWDGPVLARFPGHGTRVPRKRPRELAVRTHTARPQQR